MAIKSIEGTEVRRGAVSYRQVEVSYEPDPLNWPGVIERHTGWEFACDACDAFSVNLTEDEARKELDEHACPDIPPCEATS